MRYHVYHSGDDLVELRLRISIDIRYCMMCSETSDIWESRLNMMISGEQRAGDFGDFQQHEQRSHQNILGFKQNDDGNIADKLARSSAN